MNKKFNRGYFIMLNIKKNIYKLQISQYLANCIHFLYRSFDKYFLNTGFIESSVYSNCKISCNISRKLLVYNNVIICYCSY